MTLLHRPVQAAHRHQVALQVSSPSCAIVGHGWLFSCLDCAAQGSIKDEDDMDPDRKKRRHGCSSTSVSYFDKDDRKFVAEDQHHPRLAAPRLRTFSHPPVYDSTRVCCIGQE